MLFGCDPRTVIFDPHNQVTVLQFRRQNDLFLGKFMRVGNKITHHCFQVMAGNEKHEIQIADAGDLQRRAAVQNRKPVGDIFERGRDFGLALHLPFRPDRAGQAWNVNRDAVSGFVR